MQVPYREIVTQDVAATCAERVHWVSFFAPDADLGQSLPSGGMLGVRAPLHESEARVARPYYFIDDIEAAVDAAVAAGGEIAQPPLAIPGHSTIRERCY